MNNQPFATDFRTETHHTSRRSYSEYLRPVAFLCWPCFFVLSGCATLGLTKKDDEYDLAKRAIESYEDAEGNFIRPEGIRADKQRGSDLPKFLQKIPGIGPRPKDIEKARSLYSEAVQLFDEAKTLEGDERVAKFHIAGKKFDEAGKYWVSSYLEQDAYMMAGESYFFAEEYPRAEDRFVKLLKEYPRTRYQDRVDKRRMEIGDYWLQFPDRFYNVNFTDRRKPWNDTAKHGERVLEKMRLDSPTGRLADDVTMRLANNAFKNEKWAEAVELYKDLITTYPDSAHQFEAHLLGIKSALQSYRGSEYGQEPLEQAEKFLKQIKQFPEEARREKEQIDSLYTELINRKAERLYSQATYRYNKGEARSARIKCNELLKDYENTAFADPARELLAKMQELPDEPTQPLAYMEKWFPSNDKTASLVKPPPTHALDSHKQDEVSRTATQEFLKTPSTQGSLGPR